MSETTDTDKNQPAGSEAEGGKKPPAEDAPTQGKAPEEAPGTENQEPDPRDKTISDLTKKLEGFEAAEEERRQAGLSELQKAEERATKAESEVADLKAQIAQRDFDSRVRTAARAANADEDLVLALAAGKDIGDEAAAKAFVEATVKDKPHLVLGDQPKRRTGVPSEPNEGGGDSPGKGWLSALTSMR